MQADELSHLFCWNACNTAPKVRAAKWLQDIVYFYMVLTIKMKLKEASVPYLQISRHLIVHLLSKNTYCSVKIKSSNCR